MSDWVSGNTGQTNLIPSSSLQTLQVVKSQGCQLPAVARSVIWPLKGIQGRLRAVRFSTTVEILSPPPCIGKYRMVLWWGRWSLEHFINVKHCNQRLQLLQGCKKLWHAGTARVPPDVLVSNHCMWNARIPGGFFCRIKCTVIELSLFCTIFINLPRFHLICATNWLRFKLTARVNFIFFLI